MTVRQQQLESTLTRAISRIVATKLSDPRIAGMVSVTRVRLDPACAEAHVYISVLPKRYEPRTLQGLQHAAGRIQSFLAKAMALRSVPRLQFSLDDSLKKQDQVLRAIDHGLGRETGRLASDPPLADSAHAQTNSDKPSQETAR